MVNFKDEITQPAVSQHSAMIANLRALSYAKGKKLYNSIDQMWLEEKDKETKTHTSCTNTQRTDDVSKHDSFYQKS